MKLRDHPLMTRRSGMKSWPPLWTTLTQHKNQWPTGEVGVLQQAWMHGTLDNCLFLFIEHNGSFYTGSYVLRRCGILYAAVQAHAGETRAGDQTDRRSGFVIYFVNWADDLLSFSEQVSHG